MNLRTVLLVGTVWSLSACGAERAREPSIARPSATHATDNTGRNERDRSGETLTPVDQSESAADIAVTASIRRALVADDSLSTTGKNCKIITADGVTTLRGVVANRKEKALIAEKTKAISGVKRVDNQLEVETP